MGGGRWAVGGGGWWGDGTVNSLLSSYHQSTWNGACSDLRVQYNSDVLFLVMYPVLLSSVTLEAQSLQ